MRKKLPNNFQPQLTGKERLLFLGKTRSGKSFLARYLLKRMRAAGWRIVIVDPKKDWQGRGAERRPFAKGGSKGSVDNPVLVTEFDPRLYVQVFQPVEWNELCAKFFRAIMVVGYTIVYFDEGTQLVDATHVPIEFAVLWSQGAAISVGAWFGNQRSLRLPEIVKSQAEVWFVFRIPNKADRIVIAAYVPVDNTPGLVGKALPYRWFWFYDDSLEEPILVRPLVIKAKGTSTSGEYSTAGRGSYF